jgi:hypothetical protein
MDGSSVPLHQHPKTTQAPPFFRVGIRNRTRKHGGKANPCCCCSELNGGVLLGLERFGLPSTISGLPRHMPIRSRLINIRNAPRDEVAQHIGMVWLPCTIVALTPDGGGCGVEKAMGVEWFHESLLVTITDIGLYRAAVWSKAFYVKHNIESCG